MRVKSQLFLGNGAILGIFVAVAIVIVMSVSSLITNSKWVTHTYNVIGTANQIMAFMVDQETGVRGYMATGDKGFLEPYHAGKAAFAEAVAKAKALVSDNPKQVERFAEVERLATEWDTKVISQYMATRQSVNDGQSANQALLNFIASGEGKRKMDAFRASWQKLYSTAFSQAQLNACWGLLLDMVNMETGMRGFLVTGNETYLEPFNEGVANIGSRFAKLRMADMSGVDALESQAMDWVNNAGKTTIQLQRAALSFQKPEAVTALMEKKLGKQYMDTLRQLIAAIVKEEAGLLVIREEAAESTSTMATMSTVAGVGLAVVAAIFIVMMILRNIMRQLGKEPVELAEVTNRVSGGDFNIDDGSARIGVYGQIVEMVGTLQEKIEAAQQAEAEADQALRKAEAAIVEVEKGKAEIEENTHTMVLVADQATEIASRVASSSEQLSAQLTQVTQGAEVQQQRVTETVIAMEEMNSTVLEIARNASDASNNTALAKEKAEHGESIVSQVVSTITKVNESSTSLQQSMQALGDQAEAIGGVMNVINDIADQTNLLALNAAIEAARAGEAGRGFAVVADEVRKLAERTMDATGEVGSNIKAIQQAAQVNIDSMQDAVIHITSATELAEKSGESLREIVGLVESSASQVAGIATASQEQASTSEEINRALDEVNVIVNETTEGTAQSSHAVSDLAEIATELTLTMSKLK